MVGKTNLSQYLILGILSFLCGLLVEVLMLPAVVKAAVLHVDGIGQPPKNHSLLARAHQAHWCVPLS